MPLQRYHHQDSVVGDIINPSRGIRDDMVRRGIQPKNHMAENRRQLRQLAAQKQQEREEAEDLANAEPFKMREFQNVESRAMQAAESMKPEAPKDYLKRKTGLAGGPHMRPIDTEPYAPRQRSRPDVPRQADLIRERQEESHEVVKEVNRIRANMLAVKKQSEARKAAAQNSTVDQEPHKKGEIPEYLKKRKHDWAVEAEQKERAEAEARARARVPPGTRLVSEEEKQALLIELRSSLQIEVKRLNSFSVANDSLAQRRSREECERKIEQIEKTIRDFERPGDLFLAYD
ncbi:Calmodulin-binding protein [Giardia muris]|uniref:Calmodulin-binding protein n=1 Tax=Giardia muris TaxID=5742 RepID=A0A4Z1SSG2_GIAMU|nr:Calmodulin-binding protein [Giardia muris]|eukprot:TNJ28824.1 Calmodulin-binding protein [Giardia muris]